jgi:hypothetical protein
VSGWSDKSKGDIEYEIVIGDKSSDLTKQICIEYAENIQN